MPLCLGVRTVETQFFSDSAASFSMQSATQIVETPFSEGLQTALWIYTKKKVL